MTQNKYPEEIYRVGKTDNYVAMPIVRETLENAYDLGLEHGQPGDPLLGWSNLTEAIKAGENIDWERLDGLPAKCVHPEVGTLTYKLERDFGYEPESCAGWYVEDYPRVWIGALNHSWDGIEGWVLYIKGDIPLHRQTADQLEPGTCFRARYEKNGETHNYAWAQLLKPSGQKPRVIFFSLALTTLFGSALPEDVEVVEVYGVGTFPTPKENA